MWAGDEDDDEDHEDEFRAAPGVNQPPAPMTDTPLSFRRFRVFRESAKRLPASSCHAAA